jgi:hypothetical protein
MRLPPPLIELISRRALQSLAARGIITSDHPERTAERVARLISADLSMEDAITEEARLLLAEHQEQIRGMDLEYHQLLARAKGQIAQRRGYLLSTGPGKLSREKLHDLAGKIFDLLLEDTDVEYFVKDQELRNQLLRALETELAKDTAREARARQKVLNIKRRIPEDSPEFHALFQQFYRELLDKEG